MTARLTVTLQCDRALDERCLGIFQGPGAIGVEGWRRVAFDRGWTTVATAGGRRQDVCPACWSREGHGGVRIIDAADADAR